MRFGPREVSGGQCPPYGRRPAPQYLDFYSRSATGSSSAARKISGNVACDHPR